MFRSTTCFGCSYEPSSSLLLFLVRQNIQLVVFDYIVIGYVLRITLNHT